ncbi:MAG: DUF4389 domain-containing protein [Gaiella sp.]
MDDVPADRGGQAHAPSPRHRGSDREGGQALAPDPAGHRSPIRLVVSDDLRRSRLTVGFRLLLVLPHLLWALLWTSAIAPVAFVVWLAVLVERRAPKQLHGFLAAYVRYTTHLSAYLAIAANPYPGFTGEPGYPVDVEIDSPAPQGRRGAALRLILALPALLLATALGGSLAGQLSGGVAVVSGGAGLVAVAGLLGWFAALAQARMPRGLRDAAVYGIGYSAQAIGYALLLTDRYPSADPAHVAPAAELPPHPVGVELYDTLGRSRLLVAFRLLLTLPHFVWLALWSFPALLAAILSWLVALVTGRVPSWLHRFLAAYVRYGTHVSAFLFVVGGPFPGFVGGAGSYPVDPVLPPPARQRRLVVAFRGLLAIPALIISGAYSSALVVIGLLGFWAALVTGRMPGGLRNLGVAALRYSAQAYAYLLLLTDRYPYAAPALDDLPRPPTSSEEAT